MFSIKAIYVIIKKEEKNFEILGFFIGMLLSIVTLVESFLIYHGFAVFRTYLLLLIELSIAFEFTKLKVSIES